MIPRVRPFWHDCAGPKDLSVRHARRHQFHVTKTVDVWRAQSAVIKHPRAGTIFYKTRTSLTTWFEAAWHVATVENGMSAKTLEYTLGTSYRVAWTMLQHFRVAVLDVERK